MKGPIPTASTGPISTDTDFEPVLASGVGRSAGIYRSVVDAILGGRLRPGDRLPAARDLARRLDIARNTVVAAYDELVAEGFLVTLVGAGTFVADDAPVSAALPRRAPHGRGVAPRPAWVSRGPGFAARHAPARIDLSVGVPDAALFPIIAWRRLVAGALRPERLTSGYADGDGDPDLRAAIARRIGAARSVRAAAGDIVITNGAQQAIDLIARVLLAPGDVAAVEEPGYPPARRAFAAAGARVVPVPVDRQGIRVEALPDARLVYVTPSHQFPLGMPMSLGRRSALLAWARDRGAVIVEDDYDSEFRFGGRPLEPLQSIDRDGRVLYVGSFSKTLLPMLRLGFVVAPASLRPALVEARRLADWHGDTVVQAALARLIESGQFSRHVRRATRVYAARHALVASRLDGSLAPWLERVPSSAGLHVSAFLRAGSPVDLGAVLRRTREAGVRVESLATYAAAPLDRPGVVIGFGGCDEAAIDEALAILALAFATEAAGDRRP